MFATQIPPLSAQLTPARDLTGTWESSVSGTYYDMDPSDSSTRMNDITATFELIITQQGSQIDIILNTYPTTWVTDQAYWNEYQMSGVPPAGGASIEFVGTVSSSSFSADEQGSTLVQEHLAGTFTTDIITATLTGTSETTDTNGIVVMRTGSPTQAPTASPTTSSQPSRYFGNIGTVKGPATFTNAGSQTPASTGQLASGTEISTGDNAIVSFTPPNQGGTVYLGPNSDAGWVALTSQGAPDSQIFYTPVPTKAAEPTNWKEGFKEMLVSIPIEATIAVLVFGEGVATATAVAVVIEGGIYLIRQGSAYVKETVSHLVAIPQGALAGLNTEYAVNVFSNGTTIVQVIKGPVVFIDPASSNKITVQSNQVLTLPPAGQSGFAQQELQSDVSSFNSASMNQWWTQATDNSSLGNVIGQPIVLVIIVLVIIIVIVVSALTVAKRRKRVRTQLHAQENVFSHPQMSPPEPKNPMYTIAPPAPPPPPSMFTFCPNCGQQISNAKRFCPFCGFDRGSHERNT